MSNLEASNNALPRSGAEGNKMDKFLGAAKGMAAEGLEAYFDKIFKQADEAEKMPEPAPEPETKATEPLVENKVDGKKYALKNPVSANDKGFKKQMRKLESQRGRQEANNAYYFGAGNYEGGPGQQRFADHYRGPKNAREREFLARTKEEMSQRAALPDEVDVVDKGLKVRIGEVAPHVSNAPEFKEGELSSLVFDVAVNTLKGMPENAQEALDRMIAHQEGNSVKKAKYPEETLQDVASANLDQVLSQLEENHPQILERVRLMWEGKAVDPKARPEIVFVSRDIYQRMKSENMDFNAAFAKQAALITQNIAKETLAKIGLPQVAQTLEAYTDLSSSQRIVMNVLEGVRVDKGNKNLGMAMDYLKNAILNMDEEGNLALPEPINEAEEMAQQVASVLSDTVTLFNSKGDLIKQYAQEMLDEKESDSREELPEAYAYELLDKVDQAGLSLDQALPVLLKDVVAQRVNDMLIAKLAKAS